MSRIVRRPVALTDEQLQRALKAHDEGTSWQVLGPRFGVSPSYLVRLINRRLLYSKEAA